MSLAGDVIDSARDLHPAFTNAQTPQATALRLLNGARRMLYNAATRAHRASFLVTAEYALTPDAIVNGLTLQPSTYLENVRMKVYEDTLPLDLLENAKETRGPFISRYGVIRGRKNTTLLLYPNDAPLWADTPVIFVDHIPELPEMVALDDETGMENDADECMKNMLAVSLALRGAHTQGLPPIPTADFRAEAAAAYTSYMLHLSEQRRSKTFQVTEPWR